MWMTVLNKLASAWDPSGQREAFPHSERQGPSLCRSDLTVTPFLPTSDLSLWGIKQRMSCHWVWSQVNCVVKEARAQGSGRGGTAGTVKWL